MPLVIVTIAFMALFAGPLLPKRNGGEMPLDLVRHARLLRQQYSLSLDTGMIMSPQNGVTEIVDPAPLAAHRHARSIRAWPRPTASW